jgi:hypothetical protein
LDTSDDGKLITADATSGAFIITLPAAATAANGYEVTVQKIDSSTNIVTVDANGAETINGVSDLDLTDQYTAATLRSDGTEWYAYAITPTTATRLLPPNFLDGFVVTNNGTDSEHDIDVSAGDARDVDDGGNIVNSSSITKQIDAAFAEGTNQGGLDTGTVAADTDYFVWVIAKLDGTADALISLSDSSPTLPSGFTLKALSTKIRTDSSSNIIQDYLNAKMPDPEVIFEGPVVAATANFDLPWGSKTYRRLTIELANIRPSADDVLRMQFSDDNGATFESGASDYQWSLMASAIGVFDDEGNNADTIIAATNTGAVNFEVDFVSSGPGVNGTIDILDPESTDTRTAIQSGLNYNAAAGPNFTVLTGSGRFGTAGRHNGIRLFWRDASNFDGGRIRVIAYPT